MKQYLMTVLFMVLIPVDIFAQTDSKTLSEPISPSLVTVQAFDEKGTMLRQTIGFFVNDEADVLTSYSILEGATRYKVTTHDGKDFYVTRIVTDEGQRKIVLLYTNAPEKTYKALQINKTPVKPQEKVSAVVLGSLLESTLLEGAVANIQRETFLDKLYFNSELPTMSLGVLLVSKQGEILGLGDYQDTNKNGFIALSGMKVFIVVQGLFESKKLNEKIARLENTPDEHKDEDEAVKIEGSIEGKALKRVAPKYPKSAKSKRIQALIYVQVNVDQRGNVIKAVGRISHLTKPENVSDKTLEELGEELKQAAIEAAYKWKFAPTLQDGKPINVTGRLAFNFVH